jgi:hypothetical protein
MGHSLKHACPNFVWSSPIFFSRASSIFSSRADNEKEEGKHSFGDHTFNVVATTIAMADAVPPPIARAAFHNTHGMDFFILLNDMGGKLNDGGMKGSEARLVFSAPRMHPLGGKKSKSRCTGVVEGCPCLWGEGQYLPWLLTEYQTYHGLCTACNNNYMHI